MGKDKEEGLFRFIYTKLKGLSNKDLTKISTIGAVAFIVLAWVVKAGWYAYMLGKFKVYNIDSCYFNSDNDNIILETLKLVVLAVILFFVNYCYYNLLCAKNIRKIICFWIVEMFLVFLLIFFTSSTSVKMLSQVDFKIAIFFILVDGIICYVINIYAILYYADRNKKRVKKEMVHNTESIGNKKSKYYLLLDFVIVIAFELVFIYSLGFLLEKNRTSYKVVVNPDLVELEELNLENNDIYPIIYENNDIYILSQLYREGQINKINYNFQKVIDKKGIETIYIQNIDLIK